MALIDTCYCCNLLVASVLVGVYILVAYVIAFTIEIWWILETEVALPAPAYLLCAGYFFVFVQSAFLLHGLTVKRSFFLMSWLFIIVIFTFPEAGLVLFMSFYHWKIDSLYGLTEMTCWVCRLFINVAGLVIIQSLYSTWREEKVVMQRLQALNMSSGIPDRVSLHSGNGHIGNGTIPLGYQNAAFVKSNNRLNGSLRRSASSASSISVKIPPTVFASPFPMNNYKQISPTTPLNNIQPVFYGPPDINNLSVSASEFNAAQFDTIANSYNANQIYNNLATETALKNTEHGPKFSKTQSLLDLRSMKKMAEANLSDAYCWRQSEVVLRPASGLGHRVGPTYTQSLDRRAWKYRKRSNSMVEHLNSLNDYNSIERMNVYTDRDGRYILQTGLEGPQREFYRYNSQGNSGELRSAESGRSLAESDDLRKYRDVAL